jgi:Transposase DDE domain
LATVSTCSRRGSPTCWREAPTSLFGRAGAACAGWMPWENRSICTGNCARRANGSTVPPSGQAQGQAWIACKGRSPLALRLIAVRKPRVAADAARRQARQQGRKSGYTPSRKTLHAAGWFIVVTSLPVKQYSTDDVLDLYRLRWRIELAFKRLKSLIELKKPPGIDERSAKPWVLAHLLLILLLEPLVDALEDSPRWAYAA